MRPAFLYGGPQLGEHVPQVVFRASLRVARQRPPALRPSGYRRPWVWLEAGYSSARERPENIEEIHPQYARRPLKLLLLAYGADVLLHIDAQLRNLSSLSAGSISMMRSIAPTVSREKAIFFSSSP